MAPSRRLMALASCLAIGCLASGCGSSGSSAVVAAKPKIELELTAPTTGATVGVRTIEVAGTVVPANAVVLVDNLPAQVTRGGFSSTMRLSQSSQSITITAQARGYAQASTQTTVVYSPTVASQIVAARATAAAMAAIPAVMPAPISSRSRSAGPGVSHSNGSANEAFALHPTAGGVTVAPTPAPTTGPGHTSLPQPAPPASPGASGTAPNTTPAPVAHTPPTTAEIRALWVQGCIKDGHGQRFGPYCRCTYRRIALSGALRSQASLAHLLKLLKPFERTHNMAKLPRFVRDAVLHCLQDLPGNNVAAKPVITVLPR